MATTAEIARAAARLAVIAKRAGLPRDTLERFLRAGYLPQPKQIDFHVAARECDQAGGPTQAGFGGARGPGKSHALFAQVALDECQRIPGLKVLYLRKIQKNAREQFDDLRLRVLRHVPHDYSRNEGVIHFPNGSRILTGHFKNETDIDQYLGLEYDVIVIEEATTLSLSKYRTLTDSNRTSKPNFRPRIYLSTNPGGVGHAWFKQTFIQPAREGRETETRFIFATIDDNKFVNPEYKTNLEKNTGWKLRAYRFGDWDIAAGQFFTNWRHNAVVIKPLARVPSHWPIWGGFDYGFTHPTVCYPLASFDGDIYVLGEYWAQRRLPARNAEGIKELGSRLGLNQAWLRKVYAGQDVFQQKGDEHGKTIADQYKAAGITLLPANMARISRAGEVLNLLGDPDSTPPVTARLKISSTCKRLIECLPSLQHDPHNPEDVLKVDVDEEGQGGDDPYDALGYGVMVKAKVAQRPAVAGTRRASKVGMI